MNDHESRALPEEQAENFTSKNPFEAALKKIEQLLAGSEPASKEQIQAMEPEKKEQYHAIDTLQALLFTIELYGEFLPEKAKYYRSCVGKLMADARGAKEEELTENIVPRAKTLLTEFRNDLEKKLKTG